MPMNLVFMILRKSLNIQTIEMDGDIEMTDEDIIELLEDNSLAKLENLLVYASRLQFIKNERNYYIQLLDVSPSNFWQL